jgi:hypothetical protein
LWPNNQHALTRCKAGCASPDTLENKTTCQHGDRAAEQATNNDRLFHKKFSALFRKNVLHHSQGTSGRPQKAIVRLT